MGMIFLERRGKGKKRRLASVEEHRGKYSFSQIPKKRSLLDAPKGRREGGGARTKKRGHRRRGRV